MGSLAHPRGSGPVGGRTSFLNHSIDSRIAATLSTGNRKMRSGFAGSRER